MPNPIKRSANPETKTKEKLAQEMNISLRTLQRRLKNAGLKIPRGHISPDVQELIYQSLGWKNLAQSGTKWHEMA